MKVRIFDTPINFTTDIKLGDYHFVFNDLREICQGGPCVGKLLISGNSISEFEFGGPFLFENEYVYIPLFINFSFVIVEINLLNNYTLRRIGVQGNLFNLEKKEDDKIYFYSSISQSELKYYSLK